MSWQSFYEDIVLTPEEIEEAIFEGKKKKYFRERNKEYWDEQESQMDTKPVRKVRIDKGEKNKVTSDGGCKSSTMGGMET